MRGDDVSLLAVNIVQQCDAGRAIGIVLDRINLRGNAILVAAEIDQPITTLVAAAAMPRSDLPLVVAAAGTDLRAQQRLLGLGARRQFGKVAHGRPTAAWRCRIVFADAHDLVESRGPRVESQTSGS